MHDIYLSRFPLKFDVVERNVSFLDLLKASLLFKKVVKSSIDIDFTIKHGVLSMGKASFDLKPDDYNQMAKELIDLFIARRDSDVHKEIVKIEKTIKGL